MKSDLDRLMQARDLVALLVVGDGHDNPPRAYLTGGVHITGGLVLKRHGEAPLLVVNPMETEEAARSGLAVYSFHDLDWAQLVEAAQGDRSQAAIALWGRCLERFGVPPGKVGVYGSGSINVYLEMTRRAADAYPAYQFVGELGMTLFDEAYVTKDAAEIARIQAVAAATSAVLRATWDFIAGHRADGDRVVNGAGQPLTIGAVKRFVRRTLLDYDLEDTGMIFAQGRDAGFPHSRGDDGQALRLGQSIVFDLFPRALGGGYHHDATRTWCIGHAPAEVQAAYDDVLAAFETALVAYAEPGQPAHELQDAVLDYFESRGHPTARSQPSTTEGYVHSLGHGVGLNIHERPSLSHLAKDDRLQIGNLITIEPGLYYPERGFGVRLEDTILIDESGALVSLTDFHKALVLPLRG